MGWCACCSTPKELQLFDAVKTNNRVRVHQLLREAVDLHRIEVDNVGSTLLHVAGQVRCYCRLPTEIWVYMCPVNGLGRVGHVKGACQWRGQTEAGVVQLSEPYEQATHLLDRRARHLTGTVADPPVRRRVGLRSEVAQASRDRALPMQPRGRRGRVDVERRLVWIDGGCLCRHRVLPADGMLPS
jgi:hypothetical protein